MDQHEIFVLLVFCGVYLGMALGRWPALALDRTGIALCGAIALLFFDETTGAASTTGFTAEAVAALQGGGFDFEDPLVLGGVALAGSNTVGNVPLVVLLLAALPGLSTAALYALALLSTFAGNLLLIGSLANIIVAERARGAGVSLGFMDFLRSGVPMTLVTVALAYGWILLFPG